MQSAESRMFNALRGALAASDDQSLSCDAVASPGSFLLTLSDKLKESQSVGFHVVRNQFGNGQRQKNCSRVQLTEILALPRLRWDSHVFLVLVVLMLPGFTF